VSVHFPAYRDRTGTPHRSGEKFKVINNAAFTHNASWSGDPDLNGNGNVILPSTTPPSFKVIDLNPDPNTPISFKCDIHGWMNAKLWAFDHPYAAVTDADGKFTIKNVPAGVELYVVGWHEGLGGQDSQRYFKDTGAEGKKHTFKDGDNSMEFKVAKR
jgi:hypothetical protein